MIHLELTSCKTLKVTLLQNVSTRIVPKNKVRDVLKVLCTPGWNSVKTHHNQSMMQTQNHSKNSAWVGTGAMVPFVGQSSGSRQNEGIHLDSGSTFPLYPGKKYIVPITPKLWMRRLTMDPMLDLARSPSRVSPHCAFHCWESVSIGKKTDITLLLIWICGMVSRSVKSSKSKCGGLYTFHPQDPSDLASRDALGNEVFKILWKQGRILS